MLRSTNDLQGFVVGATDGPIGHVRDFYFDDEKWVVRFIVVHCGNWLSGREVLISPIAAGQVNWPERRLAVSITMEQVKNSPDIDTKKPVSRQHELLYFDYYGYPYYWGGGALWGGGPYGTIEREAQAARHKDDDPHLRSCQAVLNYHIHATDGDIGHVQGLLVDEQTWAIRYAIVNTGNWWLGHQVLIAPQWIRDVSWDEATVSVALSRQAVKDAPAYNPAVPLDRSHEMEIYRHYGRLGYWADEAKRATETSHA